MSDRICKDALTNGFVWDDWEFERELTSKSNFFTIIIEYIKVIIVIVSYYRYVAVAKRVAEIPLVWDVMFILAEIHPCLWFCFPLIKVISYIFVIVFIK